MTAAFDTSMDSTAAANKIFTITSGIDKSKVKNFILVYFRDGNQPKKSADSDSVFFSGSLAWQIRIWIPDSNSNFFLK